MSKFMNLSGLAAAMVIASSQNMFSQPQGVQGMIFGSLSSRSSSSSARANQQVNQDFDADSFINTIDSIKAMNELTALKQDKQRLREELKGLERLSRQFGGDSESIQPLIVSVVKKLQEVENKITQLQRKQQKQKQLKQEEEDRMMAQRLAEQFRREERREERRELEDDEKDDEKVAKAEVTVDAEVDSKPLELDLETALGHAANEQGEDESLFFVFRAGSERSGIEHFLPLRTHVMDQDGRDVIENTNEDDENLDFLKIKKLIRVKIFKQLVSETRRYEHETHGAPIPAGAWQVKNLLPTYDAFAPLTLYTATWNGSVNAQTGKPEGFGTMRYQILMKTDREDPIYGGKTNVEVVPSHIYKGNFGFNQNAGNQLVEKQGQGLTVDISPEGKILSNGYKSGKKNCLIFYGNHKDGHRESGWDGEQYSWKNGRKGSKVSVLTPLSAGKFGLQWRGRHSGYPLQFQIENSHRGSWDDMAASASTGCVAVKLS